MRTRVGSTFVCCGALVASVVASDWPQWRGPNRDGGGAAFTEPARWPERLTARWTIAVGGGHSSPVLAGNRIYLHSRQQENELISAIDAGSGTVIWQDQYPAPYRMNPAAAGHGPGPKSTPVVAGGRVIAFGISGILSALDAATGKVLWRKPAPSTLPLYGTAMSPAVDGALVIAHVGGHDTGALTAFDAATGAEKWKWTGDGPGYASPVIGTFSGTKQVITQSQDRLVSVSAADGRLLWELPLRTPYTQNSVTPLVHKDLVIYSGLEQPVVAVRPVTSGGRWGLEKVWENTENGMYMSSPVIVGSRLFGLSHRNRGRFFALDLGTGRTLWATRGREAENAAIVSAGTLLFLLKDDAELVIARPNAASFDVVRRYTVAESPTWAHPVVDGNRIFVKDAERLTLWTVGGV
ncbi:MAG: PQQ-binding-like beta-propeller repeat protein [Vicinamibacterales bacterium]